MLRFLDSANFREIRLCFLAVHSDLQARFQEEGIGSREILSSRIVFECLGIENCSAPLLG